MLEKKIEEAKQKNRKQRNQLILGLFLIVILCGFFIYIIPFFKITPREEISNRSAQVLSQEAQSLPQKKSAAPIIRDGMREEFIEALNNYESSTEIELNKIDLQSWDKEKYLQITELKEQAISSFGAGRFDEAISKISHLKELASELINEGEKFFIEEFDQAKKFYQTDQFDDAKFHIEKALIFNHNSTEALELQEKINALPEILPLLKEIKVADIENNYQKEYALINKVLSKNSNRSELVSRKKELARIIREKSFKSFIAEALKAIELENIKKAKENFLAAQKIDPNRTELSNLEKKITNLEKEIRLNNVLANVKLAVEKDDWVSVKKYLELALKDTPNNSEVVNTLSLANQIIKFKTLFSIYIKDPYKLANETNNKEIQLAVDQTKDISLLSQSLEQKRQTITSNLAKMNNKIPVDVISDQNTYVLVRGVGKVGVIQKKTIHLKPGSYTFEGQRAGFKSKLVKVLIPIDQTSFTIKVVCDEPI